MTPGARELTPTEIEDLAAGARILGAGGGGNPYHSLLHLRAEAALGFWPVVIPAESLADDDLVAVVSTMGAPLVAEERLPDPEVAVFPCYHRGLAPWVPFGESPATCERSSRATNRRDSSEHG